jgi:DNA-binding NtrC family response regulator
VSADSDDTLATLVQSRGDEPTAVSAKFTFTVTDGPDRGLRFVIDGSQAGRILVGQSPACSFRLTDREVSRRHFALELTADGVRLTDLGSTNGTFVDRVRVYEALLSGDEIVRVGATALRVDVEDAAPASAKTPATPATPATIDRFGRTLGESPVMRRLFPLCQRVAASNVPVIIEGETGTGKEVLAESIHEMGPRANGPFVVFDCTTVPASLVESELFGHERGSFTGAVSTRKGVFEQADGGTLLIDEIGDLDLALQPKLLRALERSEIRRVGSDRWIKVDVRVLAATRRNLDHEVEVGRFRDDLFHRLAVARIELPPLRHRGGDIALLARRIWVSMGGDDRLLSPSVIARWSEDPWPGNVRELRNAVARHLALGELASDERHAQIDQALAPAPANPGDSIERLLAMNLSFIESRDRLVEEFERRYVERLLAAHGGDVGNAAAASGIGRRYFQKLRARSK